MTRGFFDYEGRDDDRPRTYYDSRVAKAKREGTWDNPPPLVPGQPRGAATRSAAQSLWTAVTWTAISLPRLGWSVWTALTDPGAVDLVDTVVAVLFAASAAYYFRSWRILLAHYTEHGHPHGQERADRRIKIIAVIAVVASAVVLTVVSVVGT